MIKQIKFVSIPVADQNRALDFYTDKLGFTIITDQPFDEKQRWIELRIPKAETRLVLFTPEGEEKRIGSFMNMSFMLAGSASTNPVMFALAIGVILAWKVAGYYGVDRWLLPMLGTPWHPIPARAPQTAAAPPA